jgi:hypothetical protein
MRWVLASIVLFLVPYTYITIKYRKPEKAFEPYADFKEQANVHRLNDAGYRRVTVRAERPFPPLMPGEITRGTPASPAPAPGGLPDPLGKTLVEIPLLPAGYRDLVTAAELGALLPARIQFIAQLETDREQLGGADVFVLDNSIVIVPTFEPVPGELHARTKESPVLLTLPGGLLEPGEYVITLAGSRDSLRWIAVVR